MSTRIQLRHDTAANWTAANPTLLSGECGVETDTHKFKTGDGATAWNSLAYVGTATTPGGSTTQIQYNNAGVFAGSANLTWDNTNGVLTSQCNAVGFGQFALIFNMSSGESALKSGEQLNSGTAYARFDCGDINQSKNCTYIQLSDFAKYMILSSPGGTVSLGDFGYIVNGSQFIIDDANQKTTSNVKHEASGDITIMDSAKGLVLKDTAGTPHYWRTSVTTGGALTTADLGTVAP